MNAVPILTNFLAATFGALIGLCGVLITLNAERAKARDERQFNTKNDALLSALESVSNFLNYYMTFADRELPRDGTIPPEIAEMSIGLSRLHFYCDLETIKQSLKINEVLNTSYTKAAIVKMKSMFIEGTIKSTDVQIANFKSINESLQQEITALLSSDSTSALIISHRQQLTMNFRTIADLYSKKGNLEKEKYRAVEKCRDVILENLKDIYESVNGILLLARRELAFPINEDEYKDKLNHSTQAALEQLNNYIAIIRTEVSEKIK